MTPPRSSSSGVDGLEGGRRALSADARRNRERLLEAAEDVFAAEGTSASTEEIARRAGVGIGTLFRHFPTKGRSWKRSSSPAWGGWWTKLMPSPQRGTPPRRSSSSSPARWRKRRRKRLTRNCWPGVSLTSRALPRNSGDDFGGR